MKALICDICKQRIEEPVKDRNYFHVVNIDLCEQCHDELQFSIKPIVRNKSPFSYQWYNDLIVSKMNEGVQKNKIK